MRTRKQFFWTVALACAAICTAMVLTVPAWASCPETGCVDIMMQPGGSQEGEYFFVQSSGAGIIELTPISVTTGEGDIRYINMGYEDISLDGDGIPVMTVTQYKMQGGNWVFEETLIDDEPLGYFLSSSSGESCSSEMACTVVPGGGTCPPGSAQSCTRDRFYCATLEACMGTFGVCADEWNSGSMNYECTCMGGFEPECPTMEQIRGQFLKCLKNKKCIVDIGVMYFW